MGEKLSSRLQNKLVVGICIVCAAALLLLGALLASLFYREQEPEITSKSIAQQLNKISELSTMQMEYRDISHFEDGTVAILTKKSFNVIYDAKVKAGVDLSKAQIALQGDRVEIALPRAEILSIEIDPASLEFYDERYALFNWQDREDTVLILQKAQEDIEQKVLEGDLLSQAENQAEEVIKQLLFPLSEEGAWEIQISFEDA